MKQQRLAFLTLSDRSGFYIYDELTFEPLGQRGWAVEEVPWDKPDVNWGRYRAVIIRSTWDYQNRVNDFMAVLERITAAGVPLMNSVDLVRWNLEKSYLRQLEQAGIPIIPTCWPRCIVEAESADDYFDRFGVDELIVKPLIGANADDTFRVTRGTDRQWRAAQTTFVDRPCLIQPFVESILSRGESSLFYFNGCYSHCVVKRPAEDDFRVQEEHGGSIEACLAPAAAIRIGDRVVASLPEPALYARVDLVTLSSQQWAVIEVELIEPSLYFPYDEQSPVRFAAALDAMLR